MARVTIEDVAAATGVSRTTVSHVFSGHRHVSEKTRQLVESVARDLGYSPNAFSRAFGQMVGQTPRGWLQSLPC